MNLSESLVSVLNDVELREGIYELPLLNLEPKTG